MQENYKPVDIKYDRNTIMNILQSDNKNIVRPCSVVERFRISKILNLKDPITNILYFQMNKEFIGDIHKDYTGEYYITHALILPLMGCKATHMKWFFQNNNVTNNSLLGPTGKPIPLLLHSNATCIDTVNCNTPIIVKIDDWHSIENNSIEEVSHLISIRFE